jgi:hypothetical protein
VNQYVIKNTRNLVLQHITLDLSLVNISTRYEDEVFRDWIIDAYQYHGIVAIVDYTTISMEVRRRNFWFRLYKNPNSPGGTKRESIS